MFAACEIFSIYCNVLSECINLIVHFTFYEAVEFGQLSGFLRVRHLCADKEKGSSLFHVGNLNWSLLPMR
ncbi:MAG: hypothetical protein CVU74_09275 [Deltaproteobacteria bacterium HGW-Deltaproteobacteria-9]|nr:MAG: hypothetical protein CVU74_09275 [Deltaproteobacteria bacterium HGW-Deltaproteobacteria-9]